MGIFQSLFGSRPGASVPSVNAVELQQLLDGDDDVLLVDVRSEFEFEHDGHIENAKLMPLHDLGAFIDQLPREKRMVMVCRSGNRSMVACQQLMALGYNNVTNFNGGMISWQTAGFPLEKGAYK